MVMALFFFLPRLRVAGRRHGEAFNHVALVVRITASGTILCELSVGLGVRSGEGKSPEASNEGGGHGESSGAGLK